MVEQITINKDDYNRLCEIIDGSLEYVPSAFEEDMTKEFNKIIKKYSGDD